MKKKMFLAELITVLLIVMYAMDFAIPMMYAKYNSNITYFQIVIKFWPLYLMIGVISVFITKNILKQFNPH